MARKKSFSLLSAIVSLTFSCLVIFGVLSMLNIDIDKTVSEVQDKGLKNIFDELWEGKNAEQTTQEHTPVSTQAPEQTPEPEPEQSKKPKDDNKGTVWH